jgi:hypothetical protein
MENQLMAERVTTDLSWRPLGEIAWLLQLAADHLWEAADSAGIDSPLHSLGLGSFLAASRATEMLPADHQPPDHFTRRSHDALQVLTVAEQLIHQLDPQMAGAIDLTMVVADLLREARHSAA